MHSLKPRRGSRKYPDEGLPVFKFDNIFDTQCRIENSFLSKIYWQRSIGKMFSRLAEADFQTHFKGCNFALLIAFKDS